LRTHFTTVDILLLSVPVFRHTLLTTWMELEERNASRKISQLIQSDSNLEPHPDQGNFQLGFFLLNMKWMKHIHACV